MAAMVSPRSLHVSRSRPSLSGPRFAVHWRLLGLAVAVVCVVAFASPQPAVARDMTGKAGVGFSARLDKGFRQVPALTFRYWQRKLAVELIAGFDWDVVQSDLDDTRRFHGGVGISWLIRDTRHFSATLGARGYTQITFRDSEAGKIRVSIAKDGQTQVLDSLSEPALNVGFLVAFPLQLEHFFSDHSSVTAAVALTVTASSGFDAGEKDNTGIDRPLRELSGATVQLAGRYSGGLGYTYYF